MARAARRYFLRVLMVGLCTILTACTRTAAPPSSSPYRFIETSAAEVFDLSRISSSELRTRWKFKADPADLQWSVGGGSAAPAVDGALTIQGGSGTAVTVDLNVEIPAVSIDLFEVEVRGLRQGKWVRLYWAGEDQQFHISRSLRGGYREGIGQSTKVFSLVVAESSSWKGVIARLRIEIATDPGQEISIVAFRSMTRAVVPTLLQQALALSWYVDAGGVHRCALLTVPGHEIRRTLRLPQDASLRLAYSVPSTQSEIVTFRVVVEGVSEGTVFLDKSYPSTSASDAGWQEAQIDLGEFSDQLVTIFLRTESSDAFDPLNGLPAWGHPEIGWNSGPPNRPNVVMISLDTLRADHTSLYGYQRPTTPNIKEWANRFGTVFSTVVAPSPWTLPSHVSLFTGQDSLVHGVIHAEPAPASLTTLAEHLREAGFTTVAVTGGSYLNPQYGLSQGFDLHRSIGGDPAEELQQELAFAVSWLDSHPQDQPFFLFFHTYEIHDPYTPREPFLDILSQRSFDPEMKDIVTSPVGAHQAEGYRPRRNLKIRFKDPKQPPKELPWNEVQTAIDVYDSGIAFTDHHIGQLLTRLQAPDIADQTIVVLLSDHGEAFGEHGLASHSSLYDHDLLVPLVIAPVRGSRQVREVDTQVRLIDVMPTILDLVGINAPSEVNGRTLVPLMVGKDDNTPRDAFSYAAVTNFGIALRTSGQKYIFRNSPWPASTGWEEFYDLTRDPDEIANLAASHTDDTDRKKVLSHLEDELGGLWITIENPDDVTLNGHIESSVIGRNTRTTTRKPNCQLEAGGRLVYSIPPRESLEIVIERPKQPSIQLSGNAVRGGSDAASPFSLQIDTSGGSSSTSVIFNNERWVEGPSSEVGPRITIEWRPHPGHQATPLVIDGDLEEQLRALGYIQ